MRTQNTLQVKNILNESDIKLKIPVFLVWWLEKNVAKKLWLISRQRANKGVLIWTLDWWNEHTADSLLSSLCSELCGAAARPLAACQQVPSEQWRCRVGWISGLNMWWNNAFFYNSQQRRATRINKQTNMVGVISDANSHKQRRKHVQYGYGIYNRFSYFFTLAEAKKKKKLQFTQHVCVINYFYKIKDSIS